jgi:hypothetical protein
VRRSASSTCSCPCTCSTSSRNTAATRSGASSTSGSAAGGRCLTRQATFLINSAGVWGVDLVALWLAVEVDLAFGLIAVYLTAVNALVHIAGAIAIRAYNPGLVTAVALFVPFSVWGAIEVSDSSGAGAGYQALALGIAVGLHVAIIVHVRRGLKAD